MTGSGRGLQPHSFSHWIEGYYSESGLKVTMDPGRGSVEGLAKVESGEYSFGSVDIYSLIRYRDQNPDSQLATGYSIYNSPPLPLSASVHWVLSGRMILKVSN